MGKLIDIVGQKFGRLEVVELVGKTKHRHSIWRCRCDCGNFATVEKPALVGGKTQSCGCFHAEQAATNGKTATTHGMSKTPTYSVWNNMVQRCTNPNTEHYDRYGGRGIKVCDRWLESFENFLADMGEKPEGMSIDRIDVDGDYAPGNCRWATAEEQANNRRNNRRFDCDGESLTVAQIAKRFAVDEAKLRRMLYNGATTKQSIQQLTEMKGA